MKAREPRGPRWEEEHRVEGGLWALALRVELGGATDGGLLLGGLPIPPATPRHARVEGGRLRLLKFTGYRNEHSGPREGEIEEGK